MWTFGFPFKAGCRGPQSVGGVCSYRHCGTSLSMWAVKRDGLSLKHSSVIYKHVTLDRLSNLLVLLTINSLLSKVKW